MVNAAMKTTIMKMLKYRFFIAVTSMIAFYSVFAQTPAPGAI